MPTPDPRLFVSQAALKAANGRTSALFNPLASVNPFNGGKMNLRSVPGTQPQGQPSPQMQGQSPSFYDRMTAYLSDEPQTAPLQSPPLSMILNPQRQARDQAERDAFNAQPNPNAAKIAQHKAEAKFLNAKAELLKLNPVPEMEQTENPAYPTQNFAPLPERAAPQYDPLTMGLSTLFGAVDPQAAGQYTALPLMSAVEAADKVYADRKAQYVEVAKKLRQEYEDELERRNDVIRTSRENHGVNFSNAKAARDAKLEQGSLQAEGNSTLDLGKDLTAIDEKEKAAGLKSLEAGQTGRNLTETMQDYDRKAQEGATAEDRKWKRFLAAENLAIRDDANKVRRENNLTTVDGGIQRAQIGLEGKKYSTDQGLEGRKYSANAGYQGRIDSATIRANAPKVGTGRVSNSGTLQEIKAADSMLLKMTTLRDKATHAYNAAKANTKTDPKLIEDLRIQSVNANNDVAAQQAKVNNLRKAAPQKQNTLNKSTAAPSLNLPAGFSNVRLK